MSLTNDKLGEILNWEPNFKFSRLEAHAINRLDFSEQHLLREEDTYVQLKKHYYVLLECSLELNKLIIFLECFGNGASIYLVEFDSPKNSTLTIDGARHYRDLINNKVACVKNKLLNQEIIIEKAKNEIDKIKERNSKLHFHDRTILFLP